MGDVSRPRLRRLTSGGGGRAFRRSAELVGPIISSDGKTPAVARGGIQTQPESNEARDDEKPVACRRRFSAGANSRTDCVRRGSSVDSSPDLSRLDTPAGSRAPLSPIPPYSGCRRARGVRSGGNETSRRNADKESVSAYVELAACRISARETPKAVVFAGCGD